MWMHWASCVIAWFRDITNVRTILVGKHTGKRPLGRFRQRQEDNIKAVHKEMKCEHVNWTHVVQGVSSGRLMWRYGNEP